MKEPLVEKSVALMTQAINAIVKGDKYNSDSLGLIDSLPFGVTDLVTRLNEPFLRLLAMRENGASREKKIEQARDILGYGALLAAILVDDDLAETDVRKCLQDMYKDVI